MTGDIGDFQTRFLSIRTKSKFRVYMKKPLPKSPKSPGWLWAVGPSFRSGSWQSIRSLFTRGSQSLVMSYPPRLYCRQWRVTICLKMNATIENERADESSNPFATVSA